jgi:hypothetical protein
MRLEIGLDLRSFSLTRADEPPNLRAHQAGITQLVECNLAKVDVAGSSPVARSKRLSISGHLAVAAFIFLAIAAAKPAWKWTIEERLHARFDPARKSRPLDGRLHPELFVPLELIDDLVVQQHDATRFDVSIRDPFKDAIEAAGWTYGRFWRVIDASSVDYIKTLGAIAYYAQHEPGSPKLQRLAHLLCVQRAAVLNDVRHELGADAFDRFLYTAVAPRRQMTMSERITIDEFRKFANGECQ